MKKIGIITIESFNLGNRLQNYALQEILERMDCQVETIRRIRQPKGKDAIKKSVKNCIQTLMKSKGAKFRDFDKLIHKSPFYASADEAPADLADKYDFFVAGSDQLWNPNYDFVGSVDCLAFAKPNQKIAYAGSFGVSELTSAEKERYKKWFSNFKNISVREADGAEIIKELTGNDAPVVLDPTLMLSAEEWRKLEKIPPGLPDGDYILVYSVEGMSAEMQKAVQEAGRTCTVLDIRAKQKNGHEWAVGPSEFLYLVDHAKALYTDSFHGTVFSILFHTRFRIFERDGIKMNSRTDTLLKETGLSDSDSFADADEKLNKLRKASAEFLNKSLKS